MYISEINLRSCDFPIVHQHYSKSQLLHGTGAICGAICCGVVKNEVPIWANILNITLSDWLVTGLCLLVQISKKLPFLE